MLKSEMPTRKGRTKLELVQLILEKLQSNNQDEGIAISSFQDLGLDNQRTLEYCELINWILDHGEKIDIKKISRFTFLKIEK